VPRLNRLSALADARRIGLLGGSFNPAHGGHIFISQMALKRLALDQVWWLVSPQNPLKDRADMARFEERLAGAHRVAAACSRIHVTDAERRLGTLFTADTLSALVDQMPRARFVWLMGADNLIQLPRWERWKEIMETVPVAVFPRHTYSLGALLGKAASCFARNRIPSAQAASLADREPPAWVFLEGPVHPASATAIRAARRRGSSSVNN